MNADVIPDYPESAELTPGMRPLLHPLLAALTCGVSEYTFANMYLFRESHCHRVSRLECGLYVIAGMEREGARGRGGRTGFFMLPFGLPERGALEALFERFGMMRCVPEALAPALREMGFNVTADRDNFDYLYFRRELASFSGTRFHRKKQLVNAFMAGYECDGKPLTEGRMPDAVGVLEEWRSARAGEDEGDYRAAREALAMTEGLSLCGGVYYVEGKPVAYTLGEEITYDAGRGYGGRAGGEQKVFVVHFEKALGGYRGLNQYIVQAFARMLPGKYELVNREQDLGIEGLRDAKMGLRPVGFVRKYTARTT